MEVLKEVEDAISEYKPSTVETLYGTASNISMTLDEIRDERLIELLYNGGSGDYTKEKYEQEDASPTREDLMKSFNLK